MAEVKPNDELLENPPRLGLSQPGGLVPQHVAKQVAPRSILHRDGKVGVRQEHLPGNGALSALQQHRSPSLLTCRCLLVCECWRWWQTSTAEQPHSSAHLLDGHDEGVLQA